MTETPNDNPGPINAEAEANEDGDQPTREELLEHCSALASRPQILGEIDSVLDDAGFAGSPNTVKLIVLAVTTRLLDRPVSVALRGPSSAGKSFAIKHALAFHPSEAVISLTSMSDKALVYLDEDVKHKMILIQEEAGSRGDYAPYLIRSLLSEGRLEHVYTDFDGGRKTVRICKEGPTGLITSTAGRIDFELATRLITPNVPDTPELTGEIMLAEARAAQGHERRRVDYSEYHALHRFVASGCGEAVVPFAAEIALDTDRTAVRMRRDFASMIALVKAHALLHEVSREVDERGRVVASLADYRAVYDLIAHMVAETAERSVPDSVRETVDAVSEVELTGYQGPKPVSIVDVADRLGISRSSASRRLRRAESMGFIQLHGLAEKGSKRFETADNMPDDGQVLPHPDTLD